MLPVPVVAVIVQDLVLYKGISHLKMARDAVAISAIPLDISSLLSLG